MARKGKWRSWGCVGIPVGRTPRAFHRRIKLHETLPGPCRWIPLLPCHAPSLGTPLDVPDRLRYPDTILWTEGVDSPPKLGRAPHLSNHFRLFSFPPSLPLAYPIIQPGSPDSRPIISTGAVLDQIFGGLLPPLPSLPLLYLPFPSSPSYPLPLLPVRSRPLKYSYGVCGAL